MAAVLAQAQLLADQLGPGHTARPGAQAIVRDMGRLGTRVEKLLQLARREAGIGLSREPVDLPQVTTMICDVGIRPVKGLTAHC
jgi:two-component system OmpR family sensor kinase